MNSGISIASVIIDVVMDDGDSICTDVEGTSRFDTCQFNKTHLFSFALKGRLIVMRF